MTSDQTTPNQPDDKSSDESREPILEIYLIPKMPEYGLEIMQPGTDDARMMVDVRHSLSTSHDSGYAVFANMINIRNLVSEDGEKPKALAMLKNETGGDFTLGINFEIFRRLSHSAQKEILKGQMLRIPYGQFSDLSKRLINQYGLEIATRAAQLVMSQLIDSAILAEENIVLPVPEMWGFDRNLGWSDYCDLLRNEGGGGGVMPSPIKIEVYSAEGGDNPVEIGGRADQSLKDLLDTLKDENGLTRMDTLHNVKFSDSDALDNASKNFLNRVDSALGSINSSLKNQGFIRGDASNFIEALNREPKVSWTQYLRGMYGRYKDRRRRKTRKRPSRHCWPYTAPNGKLIEHYKGRIRKPKPCVLFIVDTSGSMTARELRCVDAELKGLKNKGAMLLVLQVDADVAKDVVVYDGHQRFEEWLGRGGTSFKPGFDYAHQMEPRPDFLVYFTDGYDYQRLPYESEIPTLWVLTSTGMDVDTFRRTICDWGETCQIDVEDLPMEDAA